MSSNNLKKIEKCKKYYNFYTLLLINQLINQSINQS